MPVFKSEYPILEFDTEKQAIIRPDRDGRAEIPEICVLTFFGEVLNAFVEKMGAKLVNLFDSEMRNFPIYSFEYNGVEMCAVQAAVGSASIASMADYLIGHGAKTLIACGSCGVLDVIPAGDVIIPTSALRDEGASYHYLAPSREIRLDTDVIQIIKQTLANAHVPFIECKTWTTDGFFRETPDMVAYRKEEGCSVVEMECATMAAVARFRNAKFGQLLYSGDILVDSDNYDDRDWYNNHSARERLFYLALDVASNIK